jgi:DNA-binding IclR family transcriptional regulator
MEVPRTSTGNASLAKANRLLLAFNEAEPELGVMDLVRRVGLNKSTVSRFASSLHQLGLLERTDNGKKYRLALRMFELGTLAARQRPVFAHAERVLEPLAESLGATAALAILQDRDVVFVEKAEARPRSPIVLGRRYPATCSAAGKAVLATLDGAKLDAFLTLPLPKLSEWSVSSPERLLEQLGAVRAEGYAVDHQELFPGQRSVAVAVLDRSGCAVGALAVLGPARAGQAAVPAIGLALRRAAADVSRRLGYRVPRALSAAVPLSRQTATVA